MSKRTLTADIASAEQVNSITVSDLETLTYTYTDTDVTAAKANTSIPVGALYVSLDDMIIRYKNEQT